MKLIEKETDEKLRGSFYTPKTISDFILKWAFNGNKQCDILEPSCGDGVFLKSILENGHDYNSITAIEIDKGEAYKAKKIPLNNLNVIIDDFHNFCNNTNLNFDIVIGNPPYIRYQYFNKEQQSEAEKIFLSNGIKYSKLMNAWSAFVVGCTSLLKENGKLGFVLPAEILQVINAKQVREFLIKQFNKVSIVSFKKLVFPSIQQDVVLILCQKGQGETHIEHIEVEDDIALSDVDIISLKNPKKNIYNFSKWTSYFLDQKELDFLNEVSLNENFKPIRNFSHIEIGITTGANDYFCVNKETVEEYNLQEYAKKLICRSVQVSGASFNNNDWFKNYKKNIKSSLLVFPKIELLKANQKALNYIAFGEEQNINKGYKCSIRDEWQLMPSVSLSDAFFSRRNNIYAKMILNEADSYTTDTMHRVWINEGINKKAFVASFYNSISMIFMELEGRSFGGGALELMPSEVENVLMPYLISNIDLFKEIDNLIRNKTKIQDILKYTDKIILAEKLGFSAQDLRLAASIREKLTSKRLARKR